jgi:outer membrane protein assembly factor BamA
MERANGQFGLFVNRWSRSTVILFLFSVGLLGRCSSVYAQSYYLKIADSAKKDTVQRSYSSESEARQAAGDYYREILDEGHLLASIDTLVYDSVMFLSVHRKEKFLLAELSIQRRASEFSSVQTREVLSGMSLQGAFAKSIRDYENNGYPFASIVIDSLHRLPSRRGDNLRVGVFATLNTGPLVLNDSLHFRSTQALPSRYVRNYIDFKKGRLYDEFRTQQTERRLREIPFIQVKRPPEIRFTDGKADLFLFIDRKKANYFNGVAGLRPDEATGKVNITGDAEVRLLNAFNRGEELGLVWRKLQPLTQDLSVKLMLPYLFNSPVAIDGKVQIYKRDTSFISVKLLAGAGVLLPRNQRVRVFVERNRSNQLTKFYSGGTIANAEHTLYGLSAQLEMLDYRWNPRRGYSIFFEAATGYRTTNPGFDVATAEKKRSLNRGELQLEYFIPVFKRQAILLSAKGSVILSDSLYENEVFRIGGLRTIRGINEESIFATSWGVATIEYRWLLEENSAIYLFADQAWYEYKRAGGLVHDIPINAGVGFNFETKAGIFTFNYALGKQFDNPVLVRNGKISFGFRSLF